MRNIVILRISWISLITLFFSSHLVSSGLLCAQWLSYLFWVQYNSYRSTSFWQTIVNPVRWGEYCFLHYRKEILCRVIFSCDARWENTAFSFRHLRTLWVTSDYSPLCSLTGHKWPNTPIQRRTLYLINAYLLLPWTLLEMAFILFTYHSLAK